MVAEAPARPRAYFADGARASRTTKGLGCRWCARFSDIQAPRCRWCSRLPHIQASRLPMVAKAPTHPSHQGDGGSCCKSGGTGRIHPLLAIRILPLDWGGTGTTHSLLSTEHIMIFEFYLWYWGGTRFIVFVYSGIPHRDGLSEHRREPNRWWGALTPGHAMGVGIALDNPCSLNVSSPLKS